MKSRVHTRLFLFREALVMSQARVFLRATPAVQDIPNFENAETGYATHELKRKAANTDNMQPQNWQPLMSSSS
jgi:hypothetical protein